MFINTDPLDKNWVSSCLLTRTWEISLLTAVLLLNSSFFKVSSHEEKLLFYLSYYCFDFSCALVTWCCYCSEVNYLIILCHCLSVCLDIAHFRSFTLLDLYFFNSFSVILQFHSNSLLLLFCFTFKQNYVKIRLMMESTAQDRTKVFLYCVIVMNIIIQVLIVFSLKM